MSDMRSMSWHVYTNSPGLSRSLLACEQSPGYRPNLMISHMGHQFSQIQTEMLHIDFHTYLKKCLERLLRFEKVKIIHPLDFNFF